jgi:DNA polymerase III gamma/tau subunit
VKLTLEGSVVLVITPSARLESILNALLRKDAQIMATLQQILDATREQKTVVDSVVAFINGLKQQIADGVTGLTAEQQSQIDDIFASLSSNTQQAADAIVANTPSVA